MDRIQCCCANVCDADDLSRAMLAELMQASGSTDGLVARPPTVPGIASGWSMLCQPSAGAARPLPWDVHEWASMLGPLPDDNPSLVLDASHPQALGLVRLALPHVTSALVIQLHLAGECIAWLVLGGRPDGYPEAVRSLCTRLAARSAGALAAAQMRTQRDAALRALRDKEQRYAAVFEMAAVGIALATPSGQLIDANPRYCEIVGRRLDALLGTHVSDITHPEDIAQDLALVDACTTGQVADSAFTREKRYLRPDGTTVWAVVRAVLVRDAHGRPDHFVSTVEDVTERKRYQDAMITTQAAERANRAKSEFLSRMSHELRTPLNAMLGFAQLLRVDVTQPLSSAQRQKIEHIERAGAHLLAMINDVLDLSRIESGVVPMSIDTLPVHSAIEDALHLLVATARAANIRLSFSSLGPPVFVRADRVRLRQVLVNLLSNAVKYNYPGGNVTVSLNRTQQRDGPQLSIAITDTGPGLTPEQLTRLFEPFNRLGAERSGVEGTGIGLVITRRLLELMQGRIEVDSQVGRGSTFIVHLPLAPAPGLLSVAQPSGAYRVAAALHPHAAAPALSTADDGKDGDGDGADDADAFLTSPSQLELEAEYPATRTRSFTVLYAEDNEVNVELVRQVMRMRPTYRLLVAHSGAQAIELARTQRPDMLLLDMHLGDMTGLDVVTALDRVPSTAGLPRVALSADALPDQIQAARERGFKTYLTKPLDVSALLRTMDECAQDSRVEA